MTRPARPRPPLAAWLAVLVLHTLLGWMLVRSLPSERVAAAGRPRTLIRLLPAPAFAPATRPRRTDPDTAVPAPSDPGPGRPVATTAAPRPSATIAGAAPPPLAVGAGDTLSPVDPAASTPARPLDLRLRPAAMPPPSARAQALADPRANSRGATPEQRMAQILGGDGRMVEEDIGDGRRRFRQNGHCLESRPSRASQLNPFDDNVPHPNLMSACD